jgi:SAM-dependent methyltransferase
MEHNRPITNTAQFDYWNEQAGRTWAALQVQLDQQIAPLGRRGLEVLRPAPGERVLDIGCGCGDTSLDLAQRVGPAGAVVGLDLSAPMLDVAQRRAAGMTHLRFVQADAQTASFPEPFDAAFSRFGVMFFAEPVAAFANIAACLRPGGRLAFVCWRAAAENPWMTVPLQAALRHVPPPPPDDPEAPGPFAFASATRLRTVLESAGFENIEISPCDLKIGGFDLETAVELAQRVGPLGKLLRETPEQTGNVAASVREALAAFVTADGVLLQSGTWIVRAVKDQRVSPPGPPSGVPPPS